MRRALLAIFLCFSEVAFPQQPATSQPVAADVAAVFARAGVDVSAVRIESPAAATIAVFRVMLAQLGPETARKIGAENARRVFMKTAERE